MQLKAAACGDQIFKLETHQQLNVCNLDRALKFLDKSVKFRLA